jgi:hypothetical protein
LPACRQASWRRSITSSIIFDNTFTNPVTVNIDVGYGDLGTGALGESLTYIDDSYSYAQALAALKANQASPTQQAAYSTLPASSPLAGGTLWMATAEEKALGLPIANAPPVDGYVGFSSVYPFSYGINAQPGAGQYYFVGVVEHEITEVMGRDSWLGDGLGGTTSYGVMDLFRYSAPGVRDLTSRRRVRTAAGISRSTTDQPISTTGTPTRTATSVIGQRAPELTPCLRSVPPARSTSSGQPIRL